MINAINSDLSSAHGHECRTKCSGQNARSSQAPRKIQNCARHSIRFVGETFFGQLLQSMRKTVGKPAYFNGGRAEEIFQQQLDQALAKKISESSADKFSGPMFELFTLQRK